MNSEYKRDYEALLEAGNKAQLEKLRENEHKDGFDDISIAYVMDRIEDEHMELEHAFDNVGDLGWESVRHEAADIANFAHMIILKCNKLIEEKE